jgi:hypothetical protein
VSLCIYIQFGAGSDIRTYYYVTGRMGRPRFRRIVSLPPTHAIDGSRISRIKRRKYVARSPDVPRGTCVYPHGDIHRVIESYTLRPTVGRCDCPSRATAEPRKMMTRSSSPFLNNKCQKNPAQSHSNLIHTLHCPSPTKGSESKKKKKRKKNLFSGSKKERETNETQKRQSF